MKKRLISLLLMGCLSLSLFAGCDLSALTGGNKSDSDNNVSSSDSTATSETTFDPLSKEDPKLDIVYTDQVTLNQDSTETQKMEVTVKSYIDGDTTHFNVPKTFNEQGVLKARYLGVNTPESTGKIEEWGKKASNFTKGRLKGADSIILETDGDTWEKDSTGERYLVWVWYRTAGTDKYVNLNLELLQFGLAIGSKAGETRYGEACSAAIYQASTLGLHVHSECDDPDFFYETADGLPFYEVDLKELRTNLAEYSGSKVSFEGYVSYYTSQGIYVENWDEETQSYYGMYVYYGYFLSAMGKKILAVGNHVQIVGSVQYWETGDSYQISNLTYDPFDLNNPENIKKLDDNKYDAAHVETDIDTFNSTVTLQKENEDGELVPTTYKYAELAMGTSICMKNLKVVDTYTTHNGGDNDGAISITCEIGGKRITVRTVVLRNADNTVVTEDVFANKTIDVYGVIDCFDGEYQIKVFTKESIVIK